MWLGKVSGDEASFPPRRGNQGTDDTAAPPNGDEEAGRACRMELPWPGDRVHGGIIPFASPHRRQSDRKPPADPARVAGGGRPGALAARGRDRGPCGRPRGAGHPERTRQARLKPRNRNREQMASAVLFHRYFVRSTPSDASRPDDMTMPPRSFR